MADRKEVLNKLLGPFTHDEGRVQKLIKRDEKAADKRRINDPNSREAKSYDPMDLLLEHAKTVVHGRVANRFVELERKGMRRDAERTKQVMQDFRNHELRSMRTESPTRSKKAPAKSSIGQK